MRRSAEGEFWVEGDIVFFQQRQEFDVQGHFLYHLDTHSASRSCQRAVSRDQRRIQSFSKRQISGVVCRQIVAHLPDAVEQNEMWIASER